MKMVSLELDKKPQACDPCGPCMDQKYPWGLEICLEEDSLKKLGIKELPELKDMVSINAVAEIISVSAHAGQNGEERRTLRLQITDMALSKEQPKKDAAKILYDKE